MFKYRVPIFILKILVQKSNFDLTIFVHKYIMTSRRTNKENAMTTAPYLVINFINGTECVDECDTLEEAREFAEEHGGKVVKAEDYSPQDEEWLYAG